MKSCGTKKPLDLGYLKMLASADTYFANIHTVVQNISGTHHAQLFIYTGGKNFMVL
jgi:hypothetical protein